MNGKNKGIAFEDYYRAVVANLIILGAEVNDDVGYPDEDEVREDWKNGKTYIICTQEFFKNWKTSGVITNKVTKNDNEEQSNNVSASISSDNNSSGGNNFVHNNEEQSTEVF